MRSVVWLGIGALLWGQYQIEGPLELRSDSGQAKVYVRLRLSPYALHYRIWGEGGPLGRWEMVLTPHRLWILDSAQKVAYFVPTVRTPAPPEPLLVQAAQGIWELRADTLRQVVAWDTTIAFSWESWLPYLEMDRLGFAARYFRKGLPQRIEQYDAAGRVRWVWQIQKQTPFSPAPFDSLPPPTYRQLPWVVHSQQK